MAMKLWSQAFNEGNAIPKKYTCEGEDVSPPLTWSNVPRGIQSFALIVDDPDAPDPAQPKMTWVHWILYNISPNVSRLAEAITKSELPSGTLEGVNDWKRTGYGGPCPPIGRHRYFHKLYALNTSLSDLGEPTKAKLEHAMRSHIIEQAQLMGTYQKRQ